METTSPTVKIKISQMTLDDLTRIQATGFDVRGLIANTRDGDPRFSGEVVLDVLDLHAADLIKVLLAPRMITRSCGGA